MNYSREKSAIFIRNSIYYLPVFLPNQGTPITYHWQAQPLRGAVVILGNNMILKKTTKSLQLQYL